MEIVFGFMDALGVDGCCEIASDPFGAADQAQRAWSQRQLELKYELRLTLSPERRIAVGSVNFHDEFFGKRFNISRAGSGPVASGCAGFGLERLGDAVLCRHSNNPRRWPSTVSGLYWGGGACQLARRHWHADRDLRGEMAAPARIVVVGARGHGVKHRTIIHQLQAAGRARLVAVSSRSQVTAVDGAPLAGVAVFDDYRRMLASTRPDVVVVATPPHVHLPQAMDAAAAGCDMLLEKPPVVTRQAYADLAGVIDKVRVACQVGFQALASPAMSEVRTAVRSGLIGEVRRSAYHPSSSDRHRMETGTSWLAWVRRSAPPRKRTPCFQNCPYRGPVRRTSWRSMGSAGDPTTAAASRRSCDA